MPTYEYECLSSEKRFEEFQSMTDEPLKKCPECGGPVRRLIGAGAGIIFKAPGFRSPRRSSCGRDTPCCGRDTPCDTRRCEQ